MAQAPKKSLGQNFLTDEETARVVVRSADCRPGTRILEVGPGRGFLTRFLVSSGAAVTVVEKDDSLASTLQNEFDPARLEVVATDFMTWTPEDGRNWDAMVGNLPYYVATAILQKALDVWRLHPVMVLMFQKEVAQRLAAGPGDEAYGVPSVMVACTHSARIVRTVAAGSFFPRPKVDSALVLFKPLEKPRIDHEERKQFIDFAGSLFRYRHKTTSNALKLAMKGSEDTVARVLSSFGEMSGLRPERLSCDDLLTLFRLVRQESLTIESQGHPSAPRIPVG